MFSFSGNLYEAALSYKWHDLQGKELFSKIRVFF